MEHCPRSDYSLIFCCLFMGLHFSVVDCSLQLLITKPGATSSVNTLRPRQNGRHFPEAIFKWIFLNENVWISMKILLKFVPRGPINNIPVLVQIMAWQRPGDKPLSEPVLVSLLMHICVTWPQLVNSLCLSDAVWCHRCGLTLDEVACCLMLAS